MEPQAFFLKIKQWQQHNPNYFGVSFGLRIDLVRCLRLAAPTHFHKKDPSKVREVN
jgi:hypothetical protein